MFLKRLLFVILILSLLFAAGIYLFVPATLTVSNTAKLNCNAAGSCRIIDDWKKAFSKNTDTSFTVDDYNYYITKKFRNGADFAIATNDQLYATKLTLFSLSADTSLLQWTTSVKAGNNPFSRLSTYLSLVDLKENMCIAARQLATFLENDSNVYRYKIKRTTLTDTFLISVKKTFEEYPGTSEIYKMITQLQQYAKKQAAKPTNYPMLNITQTSEGYATMVGLPVNKPLPANRNIQPKRLSPIKDKILTTEISGGEATIQDAYKQIELYMQDHSLAAPVIPFELIITDRSKETDTAKWITRIYYPII